VSAKRLSLAEIIEKVWISRYFESPETNHQLAEKACCVEDSDTWSSKRVHWLSKGQSANLRTTYYGYGDMVELNSGVAWVGQPIPRFHSQVAQDSDMQSLPAALQNTRWMDYHHLCHGSVKAIPVLHAFDVEKAYGYSVSRHHCIQCDVWFYGWHYESFSWKEDSMEGRLIPCREVWVAEAFQILYWSYSYDRYASHFGTYTGSFPEVAIV
jgi:hypothetical protein